MRDYCASDYETPRLCLLHTKESFPNFANDYGRRLPGLFTSVERYQLCLVGDRCSPWLLNRASDGECVIAQVFEVASVALARMDSLEHINEADGYRQGEIQLVHAGGTNILTACAYLKQTEHLMASEIREGPLPEYTPEHATRYRTRVPTDTCAQLRSHYQAQRGTGQIFSSKVNDYVASRPDYPAALFDALRTTCHLQPGALVVDIGAGTGLLTQGLLAQGYTVTAIEPSDAMRAAANHALAHVPAYSSANGTAENLPLPDASTDLITAAQAFHWFDIQAARIEFLRVLKPRGHVALIWNDRVLTDPLHIALDVIFAQYGGAKRGAMLAHEERGQVPAFFGSAAPRELTWPHEHRLNEEGLLSLVFSRSYMPQRDSAPGQQACQQVRDLFHQLAIHQDSLTVRYTTVAFVGRLQ